MSPAALPKLSFSPKYKSRQHLKHSGLDDVASLVRWGLYLESGLVPTLVPTRSPIAVSHNPSCSEQVHLPRGGGWIPKLRGSFLRVASCLVHSEHLYQKIQLVFIDTFVLLILSLCFP